MIDRGENISKIDSINRWLIYEGYLGIEKIRIRISDNDGDDGVGVNDEHDDDDDDDNHGDDHLFKVETFKFIYLIVVSI